MQEFFASYLDIGRGGSVDGILGVYAALKEASVTISNVDELHLSAIKKFAREHEIEDKISFVITNPEDLVFQDNEFDIVVSLHILEHLNNFEKGLSQIHRVTKEKAIIALPTCTNLSVFSRLGGACFFDFSPKSPFAIIYGLLRVLCNACMSKKGVIEVMDENGVMIEHLWRFPWVMKRELREGGFKIAKFDADSLCLPWFESLIGASKYLDRNSHLPWLRNLGLGSHALVIKCKKC
jgi:SAM-dependent methyltransferase